MTYKNHKYSITRTKLDDIIGRYSSHECDEEALENMAIIRQEVRRLAVTIESLCENSREKNTALTLLSSVMMQANASIALRKPIAKREEKYINKLFLDLGFKDDYKVCGFCCGSGYYDDNGNHPCTACDGTRYEKKL